MYKKYKILAEEETLRIFFISNVPNLFMEIDKKKVLYNVKQPKISDFDVFDNENLIDWLFCLISIGSYLSLYILSVRLYIKNWSGWQMTSDMISPLKSSYQDWSSQGISYCLSLPAPHTFFLQLRKNVCNQEDTANTSVHR